MREPIMNYVVEFFGRSSANERENWERVVAEQVCPFLGRRCYKVRKSEPDTSIGSCTVLIGKDARPVMICPTRLIERQQIFLDCIHLLTAHEPGNELHIVSEVTVPGGSVDYFLVSARDTAVRDFVGIELQTLDTTGTVWPERQRLLKDLGLPRQDDSEHLNKPFGMNWKHTAKTILVQIHHKISTFEHVNRRLVLVMQDHLLDYMADQFEFAHLQNPALIGDSMHFHSYALEHQENGSYRLALDSRWSTDVDGIAICLGLQAEARISLNTIVRSLEEKISSDTLFTPVRLMDGE